MREVGPQVTILRDSLSNSAVRFVKVTGFTNYDSWLDQPRVAVNQYDFATKTRTIYFNGWDTSNALANQYRHEGTINAIAQSWDSLAEIGNVFGSSSQVWTDFKALTEWTRTDPNSDEFVQAEDGRWWYRENSDFYEFGEISAWEDWATTWENVIDKAEVGDDFTLTDKDAVVDQFFQLFNS